MSDVTVSVPRDEKRAWVTRVLGITFDGDDGTEPSGLDPAEVRGRLNVVGMRLRELGAAPTAAALTKRFAAAVRALKAGALEETMLILDEVEPLIAEALSSARGQEASRVIGSAKAWRTAVAQITATLEGFKTSVLSVLEAEEHEPEEIDDVSDQLDAEIADIVDKLSEGLADQVDGVINGDPSRRAASMKTIMTEIQAVEDQIVGHEGVDAIEDNGVIAVAIREPAKAALDQLRAALAEAAEQAETAKK